MRQDTEMNSPQTRMWQVWLWYHVCPPLLIRWPSQHQCSYHFLLVNNVFQPLEILPLESRQNKQGILLILLHFLDCTFRICDPEGRLATHIFFKALHWSWVQPARQPEETLPWIPTRAQVHAAGTAANVHSCSSSSYLWSFIPSDNSLIRSYLNYFIEYNANLFCVSALCDLNQVGSFGKGNWKIFSLQI